MQWKDFTLDNMYEYDMPHLLNNRSKKYNVECKYDSSNTRNKTNISLYPSKEENTDFPTWTAYNVEINNQQEEKKKLKT